MISLFLEKLNPYFLYIKIALIVLLVGISFYKGYQYRGFQEEAAKLKVVLKNKEDSEKLLKSRNDLEIKLEEKSNRLDEKTKIITKEVIRYVEKTIPCKLDGEFRRLHDNSAELQRTSESTGKTDGSNGAVVEAPTDSNQVIETVVDNYAICNNWKVQVDGWQEFWKSVKQ